MLYVASNSLKITDSGRLTADRRAPGPEASALLQGAGDGDGDGGCAGGSHARSRGRAWRRQGTAAPAPGAHLGLPRRSPQPIPPHPSCQQKQLLPRPQRDGLAAKAGLGLVCGKAAAFCPARAGEPAAALCRDPRGCSFLGSALRTHRGSSGEPARCWGARRHRVPMGHSTQQGEGCIQPSQGHPHGDPRGHPHGQGRSRCSWERPGAPRLPWGPAAHAPSPRRGSTMGALSPRPPRSTRWAAPAPPHAAPPPLSFHLTYQE